MNPAKDRAPHLELVARAELEEARGACLDYGLDGRLPEHALYVINIG